MLHIMAWDEHDEPSPEGRNVIEFFEVPGSGQQKRPRSGESLRLSSGVGSIFCIKTCVGAQQLVRSDAIALLSRRFNKQAFVDLRDWPVTGS